MQNNNWIYQDKELLEIPKEFSDFEGFIYRIDLDNGQYYFGKKNIELSAKRIIGKRELEIRGKSAFRKYKSKKGKNKGKWVYYEDNKKQDWKEYCGSSEEVKDLIAAGMNFRKEILKFVEKKGALTWEEHKMIVCSGFEDEMCLNKRVGNFHKRNIIKYAKRE